jgi:hypothetical protein
MKINLSWIAFLASFMLLSVLSCKKDLDRESKSTLAEAKLWYLDPSRKSSTVLTTSSNFEQTVKIDVLWAKAKLFIINGNEEVVGVPLDVALPKAHKAKGSSILFLKKSNQGYKSDIIYDDTMDFINSPLNNKMAEEFYSKATIESNKYNRSARTSPISRSKSKQMLLPGDGSGSGENCVDWYLTVYALDEQGNPIYIIAETFLQRTCDDDNGGGPSIGTEPENDCSDAIESLTANSISQNVSSTILEANATTRKKEYQWKFLQGVLWHYVSLEEGVHKKVGTEWQWQSLTHKRVFRQGTTIGGTLTMTTNNATATLGIYNAGMTINYDFKAETECAGLPIQNVRNNVTQNGPVWNVNDF